MGRRQLSNAVLDSTTTMAFNYILGGNEYISSVEDIMMIIDFTESIKNMANAAFFSVSQVTINFGVNYLKYRAEKFSGNATYTLSAFV